MRRAEAVARSLRRHMPRLPVAAVDRELREGKEGRSGGKVRREGQEQGKVRREGKEG